MDFLAFWMALGAMGISVFALWFGKRQAEAAESSAEAATAAENRAAQLEQVMAYRWEIVPNGSGGDRYLVFNAGTQVAHNVDIQLPGYMAGLELWRDRLKPLERVEIVARVKTSIQDQVPTPLPRNVVIKWQDRRGGKTVAHEFATSLPDRNPS